MTNLPLAHLNKLGLSISSSAAPSIKPGIYFYSFQYWLGYHRTISDQSFPDNVGSVTRFGEMSPLWQNAKIIRQLFEGLISIWQNFELTMEIQCAFGPKYIVVNGQILSKHSRHLVTLLIRLNVPLVPLIFVRIFFYLVSFGSLKFSG